MTPAECRPFLRNPVSSNTNTPIIIVQGLVDTLAYGIADPSIPAGAIDQMLKAVGTLVALVLGQLPAVASFDLAQ
nr:hypothetical protein [Halomonas xianhensis]